MTMDPILLPEVGASVEMMNRHASSPILEHARWRSPWPLLVRRTVTCRRASWQRSRRSCCDGHGAPTVRLWIDLMEVSPLWSVMGIQATGRSAEIMVTVVSAPEVPA